MTSVLHPDRSLDTTHNGVGVYSLAGRPFACPTPPGCSLRRPSSYSSNVRSISRHSRTSRTHKILIGHRPVLPLVLTRKQIAPAPPSTDPAFPDLHYSFNLISRTEFLAWFLTGESTPVFSEPQGRSLALRYPPHTTATLPLLIRERSHLTQIPRLRLA